MKLSYAPPRYLFRRDAILSRISGGGSFLEIGAGNLKLSSELTQRFDSGTAVDFEEAIRKKYRALDPDIKKKLSIHVGDMKKLKSKELSDYVISCEVLEHVEDHDGFQQGGSLVITVPAKMKYWTTHDEMVGHIRRYEKDELKDVIERNGFEVTDFASYGFPFINILWVARAIHGRMQKKQKSAMTTEERTKASGIAQNDLPAWLGLFFNTYTFYIPVRISRLFDSFNLSEGYLIIAKKK